MIGATKLQLRGDTRARWESEDPILALREMGLETDTKRLKVGDGTSTWTQLDYWTMNDYYLEVARGNVTGALPLNKFGRNSDIDSSAEDIWSAGGNWTAFATANTISVKSSDAKDDSAGVGAQTVLISGLDANWAEASETITMDGTTGVASAGTYTIIHRMVVKSAGSEGDNAGTITAFGTTDAVTIAEIAIGTNQTLMAIWQCPAGYDLYLNKYYASINGLTANHADVELWVKPDGEVWQLKHIIGLDTEGSGITEHEFKPPFKITQKSIVRMRASTGANNGDISAGFDGVYLAR